MLRTLVYLKILLFEILLDEFLIFPLECFQFYLLKNELKFWVNSLFYQKLLCHSYLEMADRSSFFSIINANIVLIDLELPKIKKILI